MSRPKIQEMCTCSFMCSGFITNTSSYRGIFNIECYRTNVSRGFEQIFLIKVLKINWGSTVLIKYNKPVFLGQGEHVYFARYFIEKYFIISKQ